MILFGDINKDRDLGGGVLIDDIDILFLFIGGLGFGLMYYVCIVVRFLRIVLKWINI